MSEFSGKNFDTKQDALDFIECTIGTIRDQNMTVVGLSIDVEKPDNDRVRLLLSCGGVSGLWKLRSVTDGAALNAPKLGSNPSGSVTHSRTVFHRTFGSEYAAHDYAKFSRQSLEEKYPNCVVEVRAAGLNAFSVVATVPVSSMAPVSWQGDDAKRLKEEKEEKEQALANALAEVERLKKKMAPPVFGKNAATRLHGTRVLEI